MANPPAADGDKPESREDRPDILLILNDDMGYSDLGCYGGEVETPNLDRLAEGGARFTQAYNTARCCPSRASLITGLHPHQTGVGHMISDWDLDGYRGDLNEHCVTIAEVLGESGYSTYMSGKWHVTRNMDPRGPVESWPCPRGFDRYWGMLTGAGNYFAPKYLTENNTRLETPGEGFYLTDEISDHAAQFVRRHDREQGDRPMLLYTAYTAPHWPLHALERDIAKYEGRFAAGWDVLREERLDRMRAMGLVEDRWDLSARDERVPPWDEAPFREWEQRRMEVYAAQIDCMDQGIGRILDALEETGRLDNTLVVFLADNGGCAEEIRLDYANSRSCTANTRRGEPVLFGNRPGVMPGSENTFQSYGIPWANLSNTPFRLYKKWAHEGGVATPLIVHWPRGLPCEGDLIHDPLQLPDIAATFYDAAGADYLVERHGVEVQPLEGHSLMRPLRGESFDREAVFVEHEGNCMVRAGQWKLVRRYPDRWELYDMAEDRTETNDLVSEAPAVATELEERWSNWARRCNVLPWNEANPRLREG